MKVKRQAKRSPKKRALVRGEPVVRGVLKAALEELARAGYQGMRIEDVAARAAVNKTTVYRRWPTKEDLVRAALLSMTRDTMVAPSTGSLRSDLLEYARRRIAVASTPEGRSIMRMLAAEGSDPELLAIARSLHDAREAVPRSIIESAVARGELEPGDDVMLIFDVLRATMRDKIFFKHEEIDDHTLVRVVDILLYGAFRSKKPLARR